MNRPPLKPGAALVKMQKEYLIEMEEVVMVTMKEMAENFTPGKGALLALIKKATENKVLEGMKDFYCKEKVFKTSLSKTDEDALRAVLEQA